MSILAVALDQRYFLSSVRFSSSSEYTGLLYDLNCRPRQVISAINIPLSVMLGPVLACRLVCVAPLFITHLPQ
jgi:hypothetical protein